MPMTRSIAANWCHWQFAWDQWSRDQRNVRGGAQLLIAQNGKIVGQ